MKALEIARVSILRTFRDRMGLFFIVILPMILVVVLGLTYGGMNAARVGIADQDGSSLSASLVGDLRTTDLRLEIRRYDTAADLRDAVERGFIEIGLAIPSRVRCRDSKAAARRRSRSSPNRRATRVPCAPPSTALSPARPR